MEAPHYDEETMAKLARLREQLKPIPRKQERVNRKQRRAQLAAYRRSQRKAPKEHAKP